MTQQEGFVQYFQLTCPQGVTYVKKLLEKIRCFITTHITFQNWFTIRHYEGSSKPEAVSF